MSFPPIPYKFSPNLGLAGINQNFIVLIPFTKLPLKSEDHIKLLQSRGLQTNNFEKTLHLLNNINYYRLSGYWYPLLSDKKKHTFKENANFETAFQLYKFDRKLRFIVIRELEKIEVSVRSLIINVFSCDTSDPFWYTNRNLFRDKAKHDEFLIAIKKDFNKNDATFIKAFKEKYWNPLPPCWMMLDLLPFGTISMLFENIDNIQLKRNVATYYGLDKKTMTSWLHSCAYLRNICAHHARLWNRETGIAPRKPTKPHKQWLSNSDIQNNKSYFFFSMILFLLQTVDPKNKFLFNLELLFKQYPEIDKKAMGFPLNYKEESLWKYKRTFFEKIRLIIRK